MGRRMLIWTSGHADTAVRERFTFASGGRQAGRCGIQGSVGSGVGIPDQRTGSCLGINLGRMGWAARPRATSKPSGQA